MLYWNTALLYKVYVKFPATIRIMHSERRILRIALSLLSKNFGHDMVRYKNCKLWKIETELTYFQFLFDYNFWHNFSFSPALPIYHPAIVSPFSLFYRHAQQSPVLPMRRKWSPRSYIFDSRPSKSWSRTKLAVAGKSIFVKDPIKSVNNDQRPGGIRIFKSWKGQ